MSLLEHELTPLRPLFADGFRQHGQRVALVSDREAVTYAELDERVDALASRLGPTRRLVLVEAANAVAPLVAYLAALRGGHPVLLAPAAGGAARQIHRAYEPDVIFAAEQDWALRATHPASAHELHPDLALLLSTSGSTGSPKLVRLSRANLQANASAIASYLDLSVADRAMTTLPMQYCYGLSVLNSHLLTGAGLVLTDRSVVDPSFWAVFEANGVTSFAGVPHTFELLDRVDFASLSLPSLRYVTQAGGRMAPDTVRRYADLGARDGWELFVMYGQTEATARMAYLPPAMAASHPHTIGVPIPGGAFAIDSPDADGVGELVYRGDNVMLGYAERPDDLALGRSVDELRTGDLARLTPDGLYEVVGRRSRFVKPCGLRIDLDRVQRLVADHGVPNACTGDDDHLVVAVERGDHIDVAARVITDQVGLSRSHLRVLTMPELPRLSNGKLDFEAVRRHADERFGHDVAPADVRVAVRRAFADVIGVEPDDDDTFVALGGDSLSYVEVSIRLEQILGPLPREWPTTPVADLVPRRARSRLSARVDTTVVLRALAITLIVGNHAGLWRVAGGAHVLLAVAGYNFARFRRHPGSIVASAARIALPSMVWIGVVAALTPGWRWPNALLVNGWVGAPDDRWGYWYIEAIVQLLVPLAVLFALPRVRALDRRAPFALAVAAAAAGLAVRFDVLVDVDTSRTMSRPHEIFWLFALGWAAAHATRTSRRLLVSALAVAAVPGFFGSTSRELVVVAGVLLVLWLPTLPIPRLVSPLLGYVAGASLYVYLTHFQVFPPLERLHGAGVAVAGSLLAGVAVWLVARRAVAAVEQVLRQAAARRSVQRHPRPPLLLTLGATAVLIDMSDVEFGD